MLEADFCLYNAGQLVTMVPSGGTSEFDQIGLVEDGAVCSRGGVIVWTGPSSVMPSRVHIMPGAERVDAGGHVVLPGFVDAHTHPVFAGERAGEFYERSLAHHTQLKHAYASQLRGGRGIMTTTDATRRASEQELFSLTWARADEFLRHGTTTIEAKSGYGLDSETEVRSLQVLDRVRRAHPINLVATFLGPHAVPREFAGRPGDYMDVVIHEMLPRVTGLATFADVWCEDVGFSVAESRRYLEAARRHGFQLKLHADELGDSGGARLAVEVGATTLDHAVYSDRDETSRLKQAGVAVVLLPATSFFLGGQHYAPARSFLDTGVNVAVATDFNPGTSPTQNMQFVLTLAVQHLGMTVEEALRAATYGGAVAVGLQDHVGAIEPGKRCDISLLRVRDYRVVPYYFGMNHIDTVVVGGRVVVRDGALTRNAVPSGQFLSVQHA